jgi:hypothetical protein
MRAVKAKRIRRGAYGELSPRAPRKYAIYKVSGTIINTGPRGLYLRMKAASKKGHGNVNDRRTTVSA